jgi:hypothetical protein
MSYRYNVDTAKSAPVAGHHHRGAHANKDGPMMQNRNTTSWAVGLFLAMAVLLYVFRPDWVLKVDEQDSSRKVFDWGKLFLWSLGLAMAVLLALYFFGGKNMKK